MIKPKVKYVEYGIANCFYKGKKRWIELNKNLKKYPKLHNLILKHELEHYNSDKRLDLKIELKDMLNFKKSREISKFTFRHPKAFTQLIPFNVSRKGFFPDYFMLVYYSILLILCILLIKMII